MPRSRSKRSRSFRPITLGLIGASAFALSACKQDEDQATAFPDLQSCLSQAAAPGAAMTADDCTKAYAEAVRTNQESAPRYDAMASCEAEHGAGNCQQAQAQDGSGGSIFMPLLTGFLLGKMLSGGGSIMGQPLYNRTGGGFSTPGGQFFSRNSGSSVVPGATFSKPAATWNKSASGPVWNSTQSSATSRGGFGGSGSSSSGG